MGKERTASSNEREKENLHVDEERRTSSNERQYAQWKMDTLSAQKSGPRSHAASCSHAMLVSDDRELYQTKEEPNEKCSKKLSLFEDQRPEYLLELAHGYVKKGQKPKGP